MFASFGRKSKEYELLRVLVQHAGKVLTHRFLLKELWDELTDAQYLRVYVRQLRQKIEADAERPQYVLTETGIGYRLRAPSKIHRLACGRPFDGRRCRRWQRCAGIAEAVDNRVAPVAGEAFQRVLHAGRGLA